MLGVWNQNPNEKGTDDAALAAVLGALNTAAATGSVSDAKSAMAMVKQIVTNSESAVLLVSHSTLIFPAVTNLTCTLTASATANEWSSWVEIVDSAATALSAAFAAVDGHITGMITEEANEDDTEYMVQLAYGAGKSPITSWRLRSATNKVSSTGQSEGRGDHIPAGETVYARVMCAAALAKTLSVHFRYFLHT